jgi:hypothetical protein
MPPSEQRRILISYARSDGNDYARGCAGRWITSMCVSLSSNRMESGYHRLRFLSETNQVQYGP